MVVWVLTRHIGLLRIIYSCLVEARILYEDPSLDIVKLQWIQVVCVVLLTVLEFLCVYWFWLIMRIVIRVIKGNNTEDDRSDDEDDADADADANADRAKKD